MKFSTAAIFLPLLAVLPSQVSAHGFVTSVTIDGKRYAGNSPSSGSGPMRKVSSQDPNYGTNNPALNCGPNAKPGAQVADANPGSKIDFSWRPWPHNTGPIITYLASCGSVSCKDFDSFKAKWFKIHEAGRKSNGQWVQQDVMNGAPVSVTLPSDLAPGNYLVRHEIIALHLAQTRGRAEFYPSCTQIKVGGNGKGAPSANQLISLPGGYSDNDAGIFTPQVFNTRVAYKFPGPNVVKLVAGAVQDVVDTVLGSGDDDEPAAPEPATKSAKFASAKAASPTNNADVKPVVKVAAPEPTAAPAKTAKASYKSCRRRKHKRAEEPEEEAEEDEEDDEEDEEPAVEVVARSPVANETEIKEETVNRIREYHAKRVHRVHKRTL